MINRNGLIAALMAVFGLTAPYAVQAQTSINEDFTRGTTSNAWWFFNGACLTAGQATGIEPTVTTTGSGPTQVTTVNTQGQIPGCSTIASSYYNKTAGEVLVGGQNGVAGGGTTTLPDPLILAPAAGQGALRFTNGQPYGFSENGGIVFATPFPTGQGVSITFKTVTYRGNSGGAGGDGADGISFYLMDASQLNTASITGTAAGDGNGLGSWGGSLGYTCSNANTPYNGLVGAYLGLGIDEYGNFLNGANLLPPYTGPNAATGDNTQYGYGYKPGRIGLRGAGNVAWNWLHANYSTVYPSSFTAAQQNTAVQETCKNGVLWDEVHNRAVDATDHQVTTANQVAIPDYAPIPAAYVELPAATQIANEAAMARPQATPIFYQLKISQNGLLSLSYSMCPPSSPTGCGAFTSVIKGQNITTSNGPLPTNFLFGFAGSTGGANNIHEILCFRADPATSASSSAGASEKQSAKLETGVQAYFAYYNPSNGWTGRVTASSLYIDQYGNVDVANTPNWDAACKLTGVATGSTCSTTGTPGPTAAQGPTNRTILTWSGTGGIKFEYASLTAAEQAFMTAGDAATGLSTSTCDNPPWLTSPVNYVAADRVSYLRGDRSCEVNQQGVGLFRRRTSVLADIMDSSPIWVGSPDAPYGAVWSDRINSSDPLPENSTTAQSYTAFATTNQNRTQVVYVGSNDGLLHGFRSGAFNSTSSTCTTPNVSPPASCFSYNDGLEMLAYMPAAVLQTINPYQAISSTAPVNPANALAPVDYSNPQYGHNYFVDATPGTGDVFYNGQWHTWLVGGLGPGGQAIFALDITNPGTTTLSSSVAGNYSENNAAALVKGEWNNTTITCQGNSTCGQSLGNTYGTPQIRRLHDGRWGFIFGNGLGSATGDAGIFVAVLDPSTATPTFYYLSTSTGSTTKPNGIAFVTPADLDGDHITDYVYAGDLQGNLWRFDLTSSSESSWTVSPGPLFTATVPAGQPNAGQAQPITTAPVVASGAPSPGMEPQVMVLVGTGQRVPVTNTNGATYATNIQGLYGVWDWNLTGWNSIAGGAQYAALTPAAAGLTTLTPANLQAQIVTISTYTVSNGSGGTNTVQNRDINSNATICWAGQTGCTGAAARFGWYLNFPGTQEQVIYSPELVQQALTVNTIVPAANAPTSCNILTDTGFTYVLSAMTGGAFNQVFLPPDEAINPGVNTNQAYLDPHAIATQTNATGSSFVTQNASGTSYLVYETNQVEGGANSGNNNIQGGTLGLNLPPNTIGRRLSWTERR